MNSTCKQQLVAYQYPNGTTIPYATVYSSEDRTEQVMHCSRRYGLAATVRTFLASDLPVRS